MPRPAVEIGWHKEIRDQERPHGPMIYHHLIRVLDDGSQAPWSATEQVFVLEHPEHAEVPYGVNGSRAKYEPYHGHRSLGHWVEFDGARHALLDAVLNEVIRDAKLLSRSMAANAPLWGIESRFRQS